MTRFALIFLLSLLVACSNGDNEPLPSNRHEPKPELPADICIDLRTLSEDYWSDASNYSSTIFHSGARVIISGKVISTDQNGNFRHRIILQDSTGAVALSVADTETHLDYPLGHTVKLNIAGFAIGRSDSEVIIGTPSTLYPTAISPDTIKRRLISITPTRLSSADTLAVTLPELMQTSTTGRNFQNRLVRISDVFFPQADSITTFADSASNIRELTDSTVHGLRIITDHYASFADSILPLGLGDIVGIIATDSDGWFLTMRSADDLIGFSLPTDDDNGNNKDNQEDNEGEDTPDEQKPIFENFSDGTCPDGWTIATLSGSPGWRFSSYNSDTFALCTGFAGRPGLDGFDAWLITPAFTVTDYAPKTLSFSSMVGYFGSGSLEVYILDNADPEKARKTRIDTNIPEADGRWSTWTDSGNISLPSSSGNTYIGFRYHADTDNDYTTFRITNISIK